MPAPAARILPTSVFSMLRTRRAFYAPLLAVTAFGLVACSGKPENSPVIRKKFAEIDSMKEEITTAIAELRAATGEMTVLREQVSELRAFSPDSQGSSVVLSRIEAIENRLTALTTTTANQRTVAAASSDSATSSAPPSAAPASTSGAPASFGGLATPPSSTSGSSAESFRVLTNPAASSSPAASSAAASATPPARRETAAAAAAPTRSNTPAATGTGASVPNTQSAGSNRGRYHTIETGDTLEKLARDNNTSVEALREANRLPAGARPLKGQRLFIPPARQ